METTRLSFRMRTQTNLREVLKGNVEDQLLFFGFTTTEDLTKNLERIERSLTAQRADDQLFDLVEKSTQKVVGSCGFHNWVHEHERAELGYFLHPAFRNCGYMTEVFPSLLAFGFENMALHRIEAMIDPNNIPSLALVKKFRFTEEGLLRKHHKIGAMYYDSIVFSLLKTEYSIVH